MAQCIIFTSGGTEERAGDAIKSKAGIVYAMGNFNLSLESLHWIPAPAFAARWFSGHHKFLPIAGPRFSQDGFHRSEANEFGLRLMQGESKLWRAPEQPILIGDRGSAIDARRNASLQNPVIAAKAGIQQEDSSFVSLVHTARHKAAGLSDRARTQP